MAGIGLKEKTVKAGEYDVTVRRTTADESFVQNVLVQEEYFALSSPPKESDTVIDIGANIGCFALAAARYAKKGRIICVEPFPENFRLLERNLVQNDIANASSTQAAIADEEGEIELHVGSDTGMHSTVFYTGRGSVQVEAITLDGLFADFGVETCDVLKIDCEGAEFDFLPKISTEVWGRVRRIMMEYSVPIRDWNFGSPSPGQLQEKRIHSMQLVALLKSHGFQVDQHLDCVGFRAGYLFAHRP